jgi:hypothetical protein
MSVVTNVVIHMECAPEEVQEALVEGFDAGERHHDFVKIPYTLCGGTKVMETDVFTGAFNYVMNDEILDWLASLPWDSSSEATVSIYEQEGEATIIHIHDGMQEEWGGGL